MDGKTWSEIAWSGNSNGAGIRIEWEIELSGKSHGAGNRSSLRWSGWVLEPLTARCFAILHLLPTFRGPRITVGS